MRARDGHQRIRDHSRRLNSGSLSGIFARITDGRLLEGATFQHPLVVIQRAPQNHLQSLLRAVLTAQCLKDRRNAWGRERREEKHLFLFWAGFRPRGSSRGRRRRAGRRSLALRASGDLCHHRGAGEYGSVGLVSHRMRVRRIRIWCVCMIASRSGRKRRQDRVRRCRRLTKVRTKRAGLPGCGASERNGCGAITALPILARGWRGPCIGWRPREVYGGHVTVLRQTWLRCGRTDLSKPASLRCRQFRFADGHVISPRRRTQSWIVAGVPPLPFASCANRAAWSGRSRFSSSSDAAVPDPSSLRTHLFHGGAPP